MICPRCGSQIEGASDRCPRCAAGLAQTVATGLLTPPSGAFDPVTAPLSVLDSPTTPLAAMEPATLAWSGARPADQALGLNSDLETSFVADLEPDSMITAATPIGTLSRPRTGSRGATGAAPPRPAATAVLQPGQTFGSRYHIIRALGVGGMGAVYQAWDTELGVAVAMKVIRPEVMDDPGTAAEVERRFKRELLLARQVTHKNVVRIHDLGEIDGIKYITMSYVEGSDLATLLKREGTLLVPTVMRIARAVVSGLVEAHKAGVVHRDLKPANIMIDRNGDALIMDFGIARSAGRPAPASAAAVVGRLPDQLRHSATIADATSYGAVVGTVEYMAPEQARGLDVDQRADIYALGLMLYDMLVGRQRRMQGAETSIAELRGRMDQAPPALKTMLPGVPDALDHLISRCIEPDPEKRYHTTEDLEADLDKLDEHGAPIPVRRVVGLRLALVLLACGVGGIAALGWSLGWGRVPVAHEPMPVLIADFANFTKDTAFEGAVEQTLSLGVEGATFINAYSRQDARRLLARMGKPTALDEASSRLLATREGIKVILAGAIEPRGTGYSIVVRGVDPADGRTLWTQSALARSKNEVLGAIGSLAADVRKELGDTTSKAELRAAAETFTTGSLEAVKSYTTGQQLLDSGKYEDAIAVYQAAIRSDPSFGRAYAGLANALFHTGRNNDAEQYWKKAVTLSDRMTEREKYRTFGGYYLGILHNYDKAIENYSALVAKYPGDSSGHGNLGASYFLNLNFAKAADEMHKAVQLAPKNILFRNNYVLMAMYGSDFGAAAKEADALLKDQPGYFKTYLPLAVAAMADGRFDAAADAYAAMERTGANGASLAAMGRADLAMYRGRYPEAEALLTAGIAQDQRVKNMSGMAAKQIALAETYLAAGRAPLALPAVAEALKGGRQERVLVSAARIYLEAHKTAEASDLAADLDNQLQTQSRAYAKIIDGNVAILNRRRATAVDAFRDAIKLADFWMARFDLGVTYVQAEHYTEALEELELCQKRRGEATAIFLDEIPSFRYLSTLPYWLARAQEGVGQQAAAAANYKAFLALRSESPADPLVVDARKRAGL